MPHPDVTTNWTMKFDGEHWWWLRRDPKINCNIQWVREDTIDSTYEPFDGYYLDDQEDDRMFNEAVETFRKSLMWFE